MFVGVNAGTVNAEFIIYVCEVKKMRKVTKT
jgi:hypothetical protein